MGGLNPYLLGFLGPIGFVYFGILGTLNPSDWLSLDIVLSITVLYFVYSAVCLFLFYFFLYVDWFIRWVFLAFGIAIWISAIIPLIAVSIGGT